MKHFLFCLMLLLPLTAAGKKFTLVIDAGHGGNDAGAIGAITKEKTINLNVALAFGRLVERNCPDVKVIYTRKTDVFIPLHTRADIANRNKADLFISIHTNALPKGRISRGMETYTLGMHRAADNLDVAKRENQVILYEKDYKQRYQGFDPNSSESYIMFEFIQDHNMAQSVELAKYVQKRTTAAANRQNKGVKQAGFLVLRETSMPSCLIELGFISTPDEEVFLNSAEGVSRLGQGIYQAFMDYYRKNGNAAAPAPAPAQTAQPDEKSQTAEKPQTAENPQKEEKSQKDEKPKKRKKSKMAQELEDAREGRAETAPADNKPTEVNGDSVVAATPSVADRQQPQPDTMPAEQKPEQAKPEQKPQQPEEKPKQPEQKPKQPEQKPQQPAAKPAPKAAPNTQAPVFKVQIMASSYQLKANDPQLKGVKNVDFYKEGGLYKYTVGSSTNYNEIVQLRKTLTDRFPQAFIIAFKNGQKMNVQEAIQETKKK
jgi:N-acetylmuramoyl-L-alanine amidase